jgi:serine/threonine-protein kinase
MHYDDISFGNIALSEGLITEGQLMEAMEIQSKLRSMGITPKKLGEILHEKGYVSSLQVQTILASQRTAQESLRISGYEITEKLGQGGMGIVYKARQKSMERIVALKVLPRRLALNKEFIERFIREARASAKLNHENIISGIDVGDSDGLYYFAMEYADGESIDKIILRDGTFPEDKAIDMAIQIAHALEHAHKNGLVHRDVKPQNIILTKKGVAKLCDLGLAKTTDSKGPSSKPNVSVGTPHYISPEQAKGDSDIDIRSDIYSLGTTLYHMVVGEVPFTGTSPMVVMTKHLTERPSYPHIRNPRISRAFSNVIIRMMAKRADDRPQDPKELIQELEALTIRKPAVSGRKRSDSSRIIRPQASRPASRPPSSRISKPVPSPVQERPARRTAGTRPSPGRGRSAPRRRGGRAERGEFRTSRMRTRPAESKQEVYYLVIGLGLLLVLILGVFLIKPAEEVKERMEKRESKNDVRAYEWAADAALRRAIAFEEEFPYDVEDQIVKYQYVIDNYSRARTAIAAAEWRIDRCKQDRGYRRNR